MRIKWCHVLHERFVTQSVQISSKLVKHYPVLSLYANLSLKVGKYVEILYYSSTVLNSLNVAAYF